MEFIQNHLLELLMVLFFVFYVIWQITKNGLRKVVIEFIVQAEEGFKNNDARMDYCIGALTNLIPMPFRLFITRKVAQWFIQGVFNQIKIALDYKRV